MSGNRRRWRPLESLLGRSARSERKHPRPGRRARGRLESLEARCLLSADPTTPGMSPGAEELSPETVAALTSGLEAFADYADAATAAGELGRALPLVGQSLGSLATIGWKSRSRLR